MLGRVLWFIMAICALALAFFFVAAAIMIGALIGAALLARMWWAHRKIAKAGERQILTTEYTVIERESPAQQRLPEAFQQDLPSERPAGRGAGTGKNAPPPQ